MKHATVEIEASYNSGSLVWQVVLKADGLPDTHIHEYSLVAAFENLARQMRVMEIDNSVWRAG